ncbi:MAG: DUF3379 family protein [Burkholderiales bacterium]
MNCLEFRRAILADPVRLAADAAGHAGGCADCRKFLSRALHEEAQIEEALRVAVPEGLQSRVLERGAAARGRMRRLAIAASVLVAAAVALAIGWTRDDELALAGIRFVVFEEAQSIAGAAPADWNALVRVAKDMGVSLPGQLGEIHYVCVYPLAAGRAHHLLVKTPFGKVTLLLIPERPLAARAAGSAYGLEAAVLPAGKGVVVVVGDSLRSLERTVTLLGSA